MYSITGFQAWSNQASLLGLQQYFKSLARIDFVESFFPLRKRENVADNWLSLHLALSE